MGWKHIGPSQKPRNGNKKRRINQRAKKTIALILDKETSHIEAVEEDDSTEEAEVIALMHVQ